MAPAFVALASLINGTNAHSWLEQLSNIAQDGSFVGEMGYPRGYISQARTNPKGVDPKYDALPAWADDLMKNLIPPDGLPTGNKITDDMTMCRPSQQNSVQTNGFPVLNTSPGATISVQYQENGHTTQPQINAGKAPNGGTVYIYGTTDPKPDDKFNQIYNVWNAAGTGGDKRGKLIATRDFDDKQCHQIGNATLALERNEKFPILEPGFPQGAGLWCQNNFALPSDLEIGKLYTLYWVWEWNTMPGYDITPNTAAGQFTSPGKTTFTNEFFTTCSDVMVLKPNGTTANQAFKAENINIGSKSPNLNNVGIMSQLTAGSFIATTAPSAGMPTSPPAGVATPAASGPVTSPAAAAPSSPPAAAPSSPAAAPAPSSPAAPAAPPATSTSFLTVTVTPTTVVQPTQVSSPAVASAAAGTKTVEVTIFETTVVMETPTATPAASSGAVVQAPDVQPSATVSANSIQTASVSPAASSPSASIVSSGNCTKTAKKSVLFGSSDATKTTKRNFANSVEDAGKAVVSVVNEAFAAGAEKKKVAGQAWLPSAMTKHEKRFWKPFGSHVKAAFTGEETHHQDSVAPNLEEYAETKRGLGLFALVKGATTLATEIKDKVHHEKRFSAQGVADKVGDGAKKAADKVKDAFKKIHIHLRDTPVSNTEEAVQAKRGLGALALFEGIEIAATEISEKHHHSRRLNRLERARELRGD